MAGIAVAHSAFNILCTALLLPAGGLLETLAKRIVPDDAHSQDEQTTELDVRLLPTPSLALRQSRSVACEMAGYAVRALDNAIDALSRGTPELAQSIHDDEERCDHYEDILGTYLVKLSAQKMGRDESEEATELLKTIGDFERISDHAVNILSSAEELERKGLTFSGSALNELSFLSLSRLFPVRIPLPHSRSSRWSRSSTRSKSRCARAISCACSRARAALRPALCSPTS